MQTHTPPPLHPSGTTPPMGVAGQTPHKPISLKKRTFFDRLKSSPKMILGGLVLLLLLMGGVSAFFLMQSNSDLRQQASGGTYSSSSSCSFSGQCVGGYRCAAPGLLGGEPCFNSNQGCTSDITCGDGYICLNGLCKGNSIGS